MKDVLEKLKQNKDIDNIKHLMANYDNSTLEEKLVILEDLDYYMHQIDNAQDFVTLNGLNKIILPALRSSEEDLVAQGAIVLGSASQANTKVQVSISPRYSISGINSYRSNKKGLYYKDFQAFWVGLVRRLTSAEFAFLLMVSNPYVL